MRTLLLSAIAILILGLGISYIARAQVVLPPTGPTGIACAYNSSLPTGPTGSAMWVQCNSNGQLLTSGGGGVTTVSHAVTTALANNLNVKATAGSLVGFNCSSITGAAAGFCLAYNGSSTPGTGALTGANVLDFCYFDTTARGCSLSHVSVQVAYSTGIQILVTSAISPYTYTTGTDTAAITADYQ